MHLGRKAKCWDPRGIFRAIHNHLQYESPFPEAEVSISTTATSGTRAQFRQTESGDGTN